MRANNNYQIDDVCVDTLNLNCLPPVALLGRVKWPFLTPAGPQRMTYSFYRPPPEHINCIIPEKGWALSSKKLSTADVSTSFQVIGQIIDIHLSLFELPVILRNY